MRVITIGSALIDIFISSDQFIKDKGGLLRVGDPSGKANVDSFVLKTGGGAGNTAVGFSRLGFDTAIISETGQDEFSKIVIDDLKNEGVDTKMIVRERKEETGGSIILGSPDGSRMILVHRGASSRLDPDDLKTSELAEADWIHISSLSGRVKTLKNLFETLNFYHVACSWNPGSGDLDLINKGDLKIEDLAVKVLILNKEEWQLVEKWQDQLIRHIGQVVVTDGLDGGRIFLADGQRHLYKAKKVETVNATGAGDAFCVGYVAALLKGRDPESAAQWGVENSASVVRKLGAKAGLRRDLP